MKLAAELPLGRLVSSRFAAKDFEKAIELVRTSRTQIKVVMEWPQ